MIDLEERLVRYRSRTYAGRIHDKRMCDAADDTFPPGCVFLKDRASKALNLSMS